MAQPGAADAPAGRPKTLGELKASGYRSRSVKEELRQNLIKKLEGDESKFEGIVGFEETVVPQVENALLSGQDIIFLGERGQAKTRLARTLPTLLDEWLPMVAGCEINDDPLDP
ncbi:MAG: magnesium chelatase, partial [Chloroflexi bacterium]|nr:magnesium chelatase [Chloroflexota bacterium]